MELEMVLDNCLLNNKSRDKIGTIRTDVFAFIDTVCDNDSIIYHAYSHYVRDKDEEFIGFFESLDHEEAIRLSKLDLRNEWLDKKN